jgi:hypothetical protein
MRRVTLEDLRDMPNPAPQGETLEETTRLALGVWPPRFLHSPSYTRLYAAMNGRSNPAQTAPWWYAPSRSVGAPVLHVAWCETAKSKTGQQVFLNLLHHASGAVARQHAVREAHREDLFGADGFGDLLGRAFPSGPHRNLWLRSMVRRSRSNSIQNRVVDRINGAIGADYRWRVCLCDTRRQSDHL